MPHPQSLGTEWPGMPHLKCCAQSVLSRDWRALLLLQSGCGRARLCQGLAATAVPCLGFSKHLAWAAQQSQSS